MKDLKILQINAWGGRIKDGLTRFVSEGDYDIVCMQEAVWDSKGGDFLDLFVDTVDKIRGVVGFEYDFRSSNFGISMLNGEVQYECGNAILSKIPFTRTEEKTIIGKYGCATNKSDFKEALVDHRYTVQKAVLGDEIAVVNYHGYWLKDPLGDDTSVKCMNFVANIIKEESLPTIMCGDLNVIAEAPCMREVDFLTDLTSVHKIKSTLRNVRFVKDVACDHILISEGVAYQDFRTIDAPVSDHKALAVEITV